MPPPVRNIGTAADAQKIIDAYVIEGDEKVVERCKEVLNGFQPCGELSRLIDFGRIDKKGANQLLRKGFAPEFVRRLTSGDMLNRRVAWLENCLRATTSVSTEEREKAISELGKLSSPRSIEIIVELMSNRNKTKQMRIAAAGALSHTPDIGGAIAAGLMRVSMAKGDDKDVRLEAIETLAHRGHIESGIQHYKTQLLNLIKIMQDRSEDDDVRSAAISRWGGHDAFAERMLFPIAARMMMDKSEKKSVRLTLLGGNWRTRAKGRNIDFDALFIKVMQDKSEYKNIRLQAMHSLVTYNRPPHDYLSESFRTSILPAFEKLLKDKSEENEVRLASLEMFIEIWKNAFVRYGDIPVAQRKALWELARKAYATLAEVLKDTRDDKRIRSSVAATFGDSHWTVKGRVTAEAANALLLASRDQDPMVRNAATKALSKVRVISVGPGI